MKIPQVLTIFFLATTALGVEAGLLSLAHWQKNRYHQRLSEQAEFSLRPPVTVSGEFDNAATVALTNQPDPQNPEAGRGWRILTPLQTASGTLVVDRGYTLPRIAPDGTPDFSFIHTTNATVSGVFQPYPQRRGVLQGPDVTTHPKLLAFLNPARIVSQTSGVYLIARTPSAQGVTAVPPPLAAPTKHLSYALQWLGLAIAFPLMCLFAALKGRRAYPR
ncbi:MAG: SURF1 family protein [Alphaproteobacteria bacterium]|nr:MAG: SURF1 family protein [Alphaproteobacteria bacterium]